MNQLLVAAANALHTLAAVVFVGFYLTLSWVCLPAFASGEADASAALGQISRRSRPALYSSILVFALTGIYLTLVDPSYHGVGNFDTPWAILMLVKHILILALVAIGLWYNALLRIGPTLRASSRNAEAWRHFRMYSNAMAICGVLVLLLTAAAQVL